MAHIDLFGTIIMPLVLYITTQTFFGYAKPVPVNTAKLRHPAQDMAWIAAAGPVMNLILATISGLLYRLLTGMDIPASSPDTGAGRIVGPILMMLHASVTINVILFVFNLIPIPPLDGGRVLTGLLPESLAYWMRTLEPYGMIIIMAMVFLDPFQVMQKFVWPVTRLFTGYIFGEWRI